MSFIRRLFSKKADEDYETVLSNLADDIQKRQLQLSEIRLRERRSTLLTTLYTLATWVAYVSVWYIDALPNWGHPKIAKYPAVTKAVKGFPVLFGPIVILFIRRIVQIWYKRKGDAEEKIIKELIKRRRDKVEEVKKKTNYYSTRDLIQKYDDATPTPTPIRPRNVPNQFPPVTPQRMVPGGLNPIQTPGQPASLQQQASPATPSLPLAPSRRQWYDKLADAILGDEDSNIGSPSSRYALICGKCFSHNGLVKEEVWQDTQYVCPKCNHFNPSARSKRTKARLSLSPPTSTTSSPSHPATVLPPTSQHRQPSNGVSPSNSPPHQLEPDLPNVDTSDSIAMDVDATPDAVRS